MKFIQNIAIVLAIIGMANVSKAQVGTTAPDFTVTDVHGDIHHLYEYLDSGKYVLLDFFYTTCIPCQYYSPQANLAYEKYGCNTGEVIFMSIDYNDTDAEVIAYEQQYQIEFPSVSGLEGGGNGLIGPYGIIGFPTFFLIAPSRTIVQEIEPPTLQVFDYRFGQQNIVPQSCFATGVIDHGITMEVKTYPNPTREKTTVELPESLNGAQIFVSITDMAGKVVKRDQIQMVNHYWEYDFSGFAPGIYYLKLHAEDHATTYTSKIAVF